MSINFDLKADPREKLGSAESRRIRKSGNIPAVIYDNGQNIHISISAKDFEKEYFKGNIFTTIINLDINSKKEKVIANKIDVDPVTDRPDHITFVKASDKVKAKVRVRFFNREKSPGIKKGGFLHIVTRKVELWCPVEEVPEEITYDIGKMRVGQKVRSIDLDLPANVTFANKKEFNVASIIGRGSKDEEDSSTSTTDNAGGEATEGDAKPAEGEKNKEE